MRAACVPIAGTKSRVPRASSTAPSSPRAALGSPVIVGVNIGKNRTTELERAAEDYLAAFVALAPLADYVTINISSPNTPGLRKLHFDRAALEQLLGGAKLI